MNIPEVRTWLDAEWEATLWEAERLGPDWEVDPNMDRVINSRVQSVRYAALTQLPGNIADPDRCILCCQSETGQPGAWDARSFCTAVIVPWIAENQDVLGNSPDPYVSNPLRRPVLSRDMPGTRRADIYDWEALFDLLAPLDVATPEEQQAVFRNCPLSVATRLARQDFQYPIPMRVSATQTRFILEVFLAEPSGGLRPMAVASALLKVIGRGFQLYDRVESQGVTEADAASRVPGDLMCYDADGHVALAAEVKDRNVTLADIGASTRKIRSSAQPITSFVFVAPGLQDSERKAIGDSIDRTWGSGLNLHQIGLLDLASCCIVLLNEDWRPILLREIGGQGHTGLHTEADMGASSDAQRSSGVSHLRPGHDGT